MNKFETSIQKQRVINNTNPTAYYDMRSALLTAMRLWAKESNQRRSNEKR
jgi:hypothetical protein